MSNELLWILLLAVTFLLQIVAYRFFGKKGLYAWIAMAVIIANIQVMKTIGVFGMVTAMGNIIYSTTFLATDILSENYGKKESTRAVWVGFFILIAVTIVMQLCLLFTPHESDILNPAMQQLFSLLPRIAIASLTAYIISQLHDVWAFDFWKRLFKGKHLWIRNNFSTMTSQLLDNIVFTWIAFVGFFGLFGWGQVFTWDIIIEIFLVSYVMKWIVAVFDTPFIYWSRAIKKRYLKKED
ncbi:queuosine precursor transporter [Candidatus Woesearchaeota archaeon]|nr:queuosine precursor transporter [Candidatus Woesearchaeota archaeon]